MKKRKNLTPYLVTIPLLSLSMIDLNLLAIAGTPQNNPAQLVYPN